jgi:hypothetical protein
MCPRVDTKELGLTKNRELPAGFGIERLQLIQPPPTANADTQVALVVRMDGFSIQAGLRLLPLVLSG